MFVEELTALEDRWSSFSLRASEPRALFSKRAASNPSSLSRSERLSGYSGDAGVEKSVFFAERFPSRDLGSSSLSKSCAVKFARRSPPTESAAKGVFRASIAGVVCMPSLNLRLKCFLSDRRSFAARSCSAVMSTGGGMEPSGPRTGRS